MGRIEGGEREVELYRISLRYTDIFKKNVKCNPVYLVAESKEKAIQKYNEISNGKAEIVSVSYLAESLNFGNTIFRKEPQK